MGPGAEGKLSYQELLAHRSALHQRELVAALEAAGKSTDTVTTLLLHQQAAIHMLGQTIAIALFGLVPQGENDDDEEPGVDTEDVPSGTQASLLDV